MKERVLLQGVVSEVLFPNKGTLIPTEDQPSPSEADSSAGILYVEPKKPYSPLAIKNVLPGKHGWSAPIKTDGAATKRAHASFTARAL